MAKEKTETKEQVVKNIEDKGKVPEKQAKVEEKIAEQETAEKSEKAIEESVKKDIAKAAEQAKEKVKKRVSKTSKKEKAKSEAKPELERKGKSVHSTSKEKIELEREYVIPLREKIRVVPRYKKTNKAIKTIKEFLVRHMKIRDRDLNKIKLDTYLNEFLWSRGIKNPPHKVKVKASKIGNIVNVELVELPKKLVNKKARLEKIKKMAAEAGDKKKKAKPEKEEKKSEEDVKEEEEKKAAVVEAGAERGKEMAKKSKHTAKGSKKAPVIQRKALSR